MIYHSAYLLVKGRGVQGIRRTDHRLVQPEFLLLQRIPIDHPLPQHFLLFLIQRRLSLHHLHLRIRLRLGLHWIERDGFGVGLLVFRLSVRA